MAWSPCFASVADAHISLPRFGHIAVAVQAATGAGGLVVYGGVGCPAGDGVQAALDDVLVLRVEDGTWESPAILPGPSPGPRAFHCGAALGRRVYVFGGHVLGSPHDVSHQQSGGGSSSSVAGGRRRRHFYNDLWELDTVRACCRRLPCVLCSAQPTDQPTPPQLVTCSTCCPQ